MNNQTEVKGYDDIYGKGKSAEADAAICSAAFDRKSSSADL